MSKKRANDLVEGADIYPYCEGYSNKEYKRIRNSLEVRESSIPGAGNGVFAAKKLKKGTKLGFYSGKMLTRQEHKQMSADDASYVVTLHWKRTVDGKRQYIIIDGKVSGNKLAMLNDGPHSGLEANVEMDDGGFMSTTRPIEEGEELLWTYGPKYWDVSSSSESSSPTHSSDESPRVTKRRKTKAKRTTQRSDEERPTKESSPSSSSSDVVFLDVRQSSSPVVFLGTKPAV